MKGKRTIGEKVERATTPFEAFRRCYGEDVLQVQAAVMKKFNLTANQFNNLLGQWRFRWNQRKR